MRMKTLIGKDNTAKLRYYAAIKSDRKLYKLSKEDWEEIIKMGNAEKFEIKFKN